MCQHMWREGHGPRVSDAGRCVCCNLRCRPLGIRRAMNDLAAHGEIILHCAGLGGENRIHQCCQRPTSDHILHSKRKLFLDFFLV